MIVGLFVTAPFVEGLISNLDQRTLRQFIAVLFCFSGVYSVVSTVIGQTSIYWAIFPQYYSYFIFGYFIKTNQPQLKNIDIRWPALGFVVSGVLTVIGFAMLSHIPELIKYRAYFYDYFSITCIPMSVSIILITNKLPSLSKRSKSVINYISDRSLGIYIIHPIILLIVRLVNLRDILIPILLIPIEVFLIFSISLITSAIIAKTPLLKNVI